MTRARLRIGWRVMAVSVALAVTALLLLLLTPTLQGVWLTLDGVALLIGGVAVWRYRPRPTDPGWGPPARQQQRLIAITNHEPLAPLQRDTALDQARRSIYHPLQLVYVWAIQAVAWSSFGWSPRWLQALCLAGLLVEALVLWRLRRRIARVDDYDNTVPTADTPT